METFEEKVLGIPELRDEILLQANHKTLYNLANTNSFFRQQFNHPHFLRALGMKFGWYLKSYQDFLDAYHTTFSNPNIHNYIGYEGAMEIALRDGDLETADELFEFLRFHNGLFWRNKRLNIQINIQLFALRSNNPEVILWAKMKLKFYPGWVRNLSEHDLLEVVKTGRVDQFNWILKTFRESNTSVWILLLTAAYRSGSQDMVNRIFYGLPGPGSDWRNNDDDQEYDNHDSLINLTLNQWDKLLSAAISSNNSILEDHVRNLGKKYQIEFNRLTPEIISSIMDTKDLNRIINLESNPDAKISRYYDLILERYHPNNLEILKIILGDDITNITYRNNIFYFASASGQINILNYLVDYYNLNGRELDEIYLTVLAVEKKKTKIVNGKQIVPSHIHPPTHPGVFRWFQKRGENKDLYQIDVIGICSRGERLFFLHNAILSYRVDMEKIGAKCMIEAVSSENIIIVNRLLDDYRIGCLKFSDKEKELIVAFGKKNKLSDLYGDVQFSEDIPEILKIHQMTHLSYYDRYQLMEKTPDFSMVRKLKDHYLMSDQALADELNKKQILYIPCFNRLACAIFLTHEITVISDNRLIEFIDLVPIIPVGIYRYLQAAVYHMLEHGTLSLEV